jgi:hypothetical protein
MSAPVPTATTGVGNGSRPAAVPVPSSAAPNWADPDDGSPAAAATAPGDTHSTPAAQEGDALAPAPAHVAGGRQVTGPNRPVPVVTVTPVAFSAGTSVARVSPAATWNALLNPPPALTVNVTGLDFARVLAVRAVIVPSHPWTNATDALPSIRHDRTPRLNVVVLGLPNPPW